MHEPDAVARHQALWYVSDELDIAADRAGIQMTWIDAVDDFPVPTEPTRTWKLVQALASAKVVHTAILDRRASRQADVNAEAHRPERGA